MNKPIENWEEALPQIVIDVVGWRDGMGVEWTANMLKKWVRKTLKQEIARVGEEIIGQDMDEIPMNIAIYKHQDYAYKAGFNHRALYQRKHLQEILAKL